MNEQGILHIPDSKYCFPLDNNRLVLRLRMDRKDQPEKVEVIYESKYIIQDKQQSVLMEKKYEDECLQSGYFSESFYGYGNFC